MKVEELDIWGAKPPAKWVREAAGRWGDLVERAALLFMDLLASSPLPRTETEILVALWREPDAAEPAILAERLRVSRQSMTGLLDKLESGGYVARAGHPTDRRRRPRSAPRCPRSSPSSTSRRTGCRRGSDE